MKFVSKFSVYTTVSITTAIGYIIQAVVDHKQFFPTVVALTNSKPFGIVLANAMLALLLLVSSLIIWIFFGTLQRLERQRLTELFCYQFVETALALTYFRTSITTYVTGQLVLVSFLKLLHNLCVIRHENLEQQTRVPQRQITKLALLLSFLFQIDLLFALVCLNKVLTEGVSVSLLLTLDFSVMTITCIAATIRLLLHRIEMRMEREWESKAILRFYVEIFSDITQCVLYVTFFATMCRVSSLPIHLVRELVIHVGQTFKTLKAFASYKKLVGDLDNKFADATKEQIEHDPTCAICYDEMEHGPQAAQVVKRLPCNHCFHRNCLRRWMERHTNCPYCRQELSVLLVKAEEERLMQQVQRTPNLGPAAGQQQQQQQQQPGAAPAPAGSTTNNAAEEVFEMTPHQENEFQQVYRMYTQAIQQAQQQSQGHQQSQASASAPSLGGGAAAPAARAGTPMDTPQDDVQSSTFFSREPSAHMAMGDATQTAATNSSNLSNLSSPEQSLPQASSSSPLSLAAKAAQDRYLARQREQQQQQQQQQEQQAQPTSTKSNQLVVDQPNENHERRTSMRMLQEEVEAYRVYERKVADARDELRRSIAELVRKYE